MARDIQNASLQKQDDKCFNLMTCNCSLMKAFVLWPDYLNHVSLAFLLALLA